MKNTLKFSLRNLTRQKRRNAILAIAIAFGFFVVTAIDGLTSGMVSNFEDMITQFTGGTVLIAGYEKPAVPEGEKSKLVGIIRDRNYIQNLINENAIDYKYCSRFTMAGGQLIFNGKKAMTAVYGRDLSEKELLSSFQYVSGGKENLNDPNALIISDKIAESLNLQVGDTVVFTTETIYGQSNVADFNIAAITKSTSLVNTMQAYAHIETINSLVEIPEGGYTTFTIHLNNKNKQDKVANKIEELIRNDGINVSSRMLAFKTNPQNPGKGIDKQFTSDDYHWDGVKYAVETLNDEIPAIKTVLSVVHVVTTDILIVILLIVMVGVSNSYRMVLLERIKEIGTMRALGMTSRDTKRVFTNEAIILCLIGAVAGFILSLIVMGIVHLIPITNDSLQFFLKGGHFTFKLSLPVIIMQYALLIILTSFAVSGSAKKASSMSPASALR